MTSISAINFNTLLGALPIWNNKKVRGKWALPIVEDNPVSNLLKIKINMEKILIQYQNSRVNGEKTDSNYDKYLQFPNINVGSLAAKIVSLSDSDDTKMYKIEKWVQNNISYTTDIKNYGQMEYWALPTLTVNKKLADCEDGAFLIHSLGLNAGVSPEKLRTYGGLVRTDSVTAPLGGHSWTAYKREVDGEWITLDWCYYPTSQALSERVIMKEDMKYIDDYFYLGKLEGTIETPFTNKIRYAQNQSSFKGFLVDIGG